MRLAGKANAAFIVLGKNTGWKNESDMGAAQNRRLHRIPHAKVWALVKQKAWVEGRVALETEESFTSRMSFAHGDPLPVHPREAARAQAKRAKAAKLRSSRRAMQLPYWNQHQQRTRTKQQK